MLDILFTILYLLIYLQLREIFFHYEKYKTIGLTLDEETCLACHADHCCSSSSSFCLLALKSVQR